LDKRFGHRKSGRGKAAEKNRQQIEQNQQSNRWVVCFFFLLGVSFFPRGVFAV
jgi:hypothetical protein